MILSYIIEHTLGDIGRRLIATWSERRPVVEVDDLHGAVGIDDTVASIDLDIHDIRCLLAYLLKAILIEGETVRLAIDSLRAIFRMALIVGIKPIEEGLTAHTIELHQVAHQVAIDHGALDAAIEILMEHLLRLLYVAAIAHILLVHRMEVATLDPARGESGTFQLTAHILIGIHDDAVGIGDIIAHQDASHPLACTILDAIATVHHQAAAILEADKFFDRLLFATHIQDDIFPDILLLKLRFAIHRHLATTLAELVGDSIEDCGIIPDMIG